MSDTSLSDHVHTKVRTLSASAERLLTLGRSRLEREIEALSARLPFFCAGPTSPDRFYCITTTRTRSRSFSGSIWRTISATSPVGIFGRGFLSRQGASFAGRARLSCIHCRRLFEWDTASLAEQEDHKRRPLLEVGQRSLDDRHAALSCRFRRPAQAAKSDPVADISPDKYQLQGLQAGRSFSARMR